MRKRKTFAPLLAALSLLGGQAAAFAAPPPVDAVSIAQVTDAKGDIYKRGFVDWNKEIWGEPSQAKIGDTLEEGMQLGTGEKSWAQLKWKHITTRAWEKSIYAIAPNQRLVYLIGGELLFQLDKNRKDKKEYYVWTNLLQARIRGTTVMVQSNGNNSRISVLEGSIDVENRTDHSIIHLKPGVVMEVQSKTPIGASATNGSDTSVGKNFSTAPSAATAFLKAIAASRNSVSSTQSQSTYSGSGNSPVGSESSAGSASVQSSSTTPPDGSGASTSGGGVSGLVGGTLGSTSNLVNGTLGTVSDTVDHLGNTVGGVTSTLTKTVGNLTNTVTDTVGGLGNTVTGTVGGLGNTVTGTVDGLGNTVSGTVDGLGNTVSGTVGGLGNTVSGTVGGLGNTVSGTVGGLGDTVSGTVGGLGDTVSGTVGGVAHTASSTVGGVTNIVSSTLGGLAVNETLLNPANAKVTTTMVTNGDTRITVFETAKTITTLYSADAKNLVNSPLVSGFPAPIPSLGLIQTALSDPSAAKPIASNAEILRVPQLLSYNIGQTVGTLLPLPASVGNWPPTAVINPASVVKNTVATVPSILTGSLKTVAAGGTGNNQYSPENPLTQLPVSDVLLGPQLPGGIAPVNNALAIASNALTGPLLTNPLVRTNLSSTLSSIIGGAETPLIAALALATTPSTVPPTTMPTITVPSVNVGPIGVGPIGVGPIGVGPIGIGPIGVGPITVPPISIPPISVPPISLPPIGLPPISLPPISLPPISVPPISVPPISLPPISVPPISVPPISIPPISVPPISVPPISTPPITVPPVAGLPPITVPPITIQLPPLGGLFGGGGSVGRAGR